MHTQKIQPIFIDPVKRRVWVNYQLQLKGLSLAALARKHNVNRNAACNALLKPYPKMEKAIAEAIGVDVQQLFPERFHPDGSRVTKRNPISTSDLHPENLNTTAVACK